MSLSRPALPICTMFFCHSRIAGFASRAASGGEHRIVGLVTKNSQAGLPSFSLSLSLSLSLFSTYPKQFPAFLRVTEFYIYERNFVLSKWWNILFSLFTGR